MSEYVLLLKWRDNQPPLCEYTGKLCTLFKEAKRSENDAAKPE